MKMASSSEETSFARKRLGGSADVMAASGPVRLIFKPHRPTSSDVRRLRLPQPACHEPAASHDGRFWLRAARSRVL